MKSRRVFRRLLTLVILIILLIASAIVLDDETMALDDHARKGTTGAYILLKDGVTHYELAGPEEAPVIVLIHGGSVPYFGWDRTFRPLVNSGFRVLRYDLFGRGYSDRPNVVYNPEFYRRQLQQLLSALNITKPVHLVGVSMGAAIASDFADLFPERALRLCLINPVGFPVNLPTSEKLIHVPLLGEYVFTLIGPASMISFVNKDFTVSPPPVYVNAYRDQMQYKGFRHAMISTLRNMPMNDCQDLYARIGKSDRSILLIWGKEDKVTPFQNSTLARTLMPRAKFVPIEGSGHAAHFERPDLVNPALIDFLK